MAPNTVLIVTIIKKGWSDQVMEASMKAGAEGGIGGIAAAGAQADERGGWLGEKEQGEREQGGAQLHGRLTSRGASALRG